MLLQGSRALLRSGGLPGTSSVVTQAAPAGARHLSLWGGRRRHDPLDSIFDNFDRAITSRIHEAFNSVGVPLLGGGGRQGGGHAGQGGSSALTTTNDSPFSLAPFTGGFGGLLPGEGLPLALGVDFVETDDGYKVKADVPGLSKNDVNVTMKEGVLNISGEKKVDKKDEKQHVVERVYGKFSRSIVLPPDADAENVTAKLENGVLELSLKKRPVPPEQEPKKIAIEG
ncbi:hypothetical protein HK101_006741 [Irineochytrium annulatum]|nr:hypothetical protein HK101_006741 [Irineochytrium annulatum]